MADTQANDAFDDELLSAYVDGELSGDQAAQVEQRLSVDPKAKQLVEEMRALSDTLQAMPCETANKDLREAVLQRTVTLPREGRATRGVRRWGWAAMALAAGLLLMVFQPTEERDGQPLASVDASRKEAAEPAPEWQASMAADAEVDEEMLENEATFAKTVLPESSAAAVDMAEAAPTVPVVPIQEVHLVLAGGVAEFDKLLVSNGLVRVDRMQRKAAAQVGRARSLRMENRQLAAAMESKRKAAVVGEVLAEGTAEQMRNMLFAYQTDQRLYGEVSDDDREGGSVVGGARKLEAMERIQVLFILHPAQQTAKPAAASKKARSREKVGGKEG